MTAEYVRGWYAAMDHVANFLNALDTEDLSKQKIRAAIIKECSSLARD